MLYSPPSLTRKLISKTFALHWRDLPSDVEHLIKACVLDFLGVSIAAANNLAIRRLRDYTLQKGGSRQSTLIGTADRVAAEDASLVNGAIGHMLDISDRLRNGVPRRAVGRAGSL
jgi:2-methylcitrate dehydratase PrpD